MRGDFSFYGPRMALLGTDRRADRLTGVARRQKKETLPVLPFPTVSRRQFGAALLALPMLVAVGVPVEAASSADMLADVPTVNEHAINTVACGQAAATMVLDYYLPQFGAPSGRVSIGTVARYVKFSYRYGVPTGTSPTNLARGLEAAATALGAPLTATWEQARADDWLSALRGQVEAGRPVIVYLTDGGMLWGGAWRYSHYIVVSGLTAGGQVLYHDPFDGREHSVSAATFARVWGNGARRTWTYLRITPA
jgi:hypothetical protein